MRTRMGLLCGILVLSASCASDGGRTSGHTVRDSAGVTIIENSSSVWGENDAWRLSQEPTVGIGGLDGDPEYELYRVMDVLRLADGRLVVVNAGSNEIRFYDEGGRYLSASGGEGEGPGEYQGLYWVQVFGGDSLIAYDMRLRRLSVLNAQGEFQRNVAVRSAGETMVRVVGVFGDGTILSYGSSRSGSDRPTGLMRSTDNVFLHSTTGDLVDSIGTFPGDERFVHSMNGPTIVMQAFFGRSSRLVVEHERYLVATNDSYEIKIYTRDGTLTSIVRRELDHLRVSEEDVQVLRDRMVGDDTPPDMKTMFEGVFDAMSTPETMPAFSSAMFDDLGNLWVEEYRRPGDEVRRWTVFDAEGAMLGTIPLPEGFRLMHAGNDFVLGIWRDELDVERVLMYELIKGEEG